MRPFLFIIMLMPCYLNARAQEVVPYSVVIDEIMADPSPVIGLPEAEYIELRNVSSLPVNLLGWKIGDTGSYASITTGFILAPDSFVVICSSASVTLLSGYGKCIGLAGFPSLNNDADEIYIRSKEGRTIHAVPYSLSWYGNAVKSRGGWSLEMIDLHNPCSGAANWKASVAVAGGTPGKLNAVNGVNPDIYAPQPQSCFAKDSLNLELAFSETVDSSQAGIARHYFVGSGIGEPLSVSCAGPLFNTVRLQLPRPINRHTIYDIDVNGIIDCAGNGMAASLRIRTGLAEMPHAMNLVINEILFNPRPGGTDYVELYNRSQDVLDLADFLIANRSAANALGTPVRLSAQHRLLFPGDYLVVAADTDLLKTQYNIQNPDALVPLSSLPSLPDDSGDLVLLNSAGEIIDELAYDAAWQFPLISNPEGVALERIDYNRPTQEKGNWHSAATSAGFGTPGYANSQFRADAGFSDEWRAEPPVFSPDNDGFDDFLTIHYQLPEPGMVCNMTVFDAMGRMVRMLVRNAVCGRQGQFRWDGLAENGTRLPVGIYVLVTELYNLHGQTKKYRQAITLARRL